MREYVVHCRGCDDRQIQESEDARALMAYRSSRKRAVTCPCPCRPSRLIFSHQTCIPFTSCSWAYYVREFLGQGCRTDTEKICFTLMPSTSACCARNIKLAVAIIPPTKSSISAEDCKKCRRRELCMKFIARSGAKRVRRDIQRAGALIAPCVSGTAQSSGRALF